MSDQALARRTAVKLYFAGTDVTDAVEKYLCSLTYTDKEDGESDDLQIKLDDRDGEWLGGWVEDMLNAAITPATLSYGSGHSYKVTAQSGLNVRSGAGTSFSRVGGLPCGTSVTVESVSNGWAKISFNDKTAYVSANYLSDSAGSTNSSKESGDGKDVYDGKLKIAAVIVAKNWYDDGSDRVLDCGTFELDEPKMSSPPSTLTLKCTSLPYTAQIRQTKRNQAWEDYTLSGIAQEIASRNGMSCMYEAADDPHYSRREQINTADIAFLKKLCGDAGIALKVTNHILVLFDQAEYEKKQAVYTIKRGDGEYTNYTLSNTSCDTDYSACHVKYTDPATGRVIEATYKSEDSSGGEDSQTLEVHAKVKSKSEALALAKKALRKKVKFERQVDFTLVGNPEIVSGVNIMLDGFGSFDGKYLITEARHDVSRSGYTTKIKARCVLENY